MLARRLPTILPPLGEEEALEVIAGAGRMRVRDVLLAFPIPQRRGVEMGLAWMAKYGFIDWLG